MDALIVIAPIEIPETDFRRFIEDAGGYWTPQAPGGTVETPNAIVFLSKMDEAESVGYGENEVRQLTSMIGAAPKGFLILHKGSRPQSPALALDLAQRAVTRFRGIVDDDTGSLFAP